MDPKQKFIARCPPNMSYNPPPSLAEDAFNPQGVPHQRVNTTSSTFSDTATLTSGSGFASGSAKHPTRESSLPTVPLGLGDVGGIPKIVPPSHPYRTLVLCFDGTGDQFDQDNSNVVELFSMLKKDDPGEQLVYYQAGIGTYTSPKVATPFFASVSKTLDEMIAWNLDAHIMSGYEFLMQNYRGTDRICIFGFSRGAYTARCLAGMLHKVGLLPTCNHQQVPFAYKMYTRTDAIGWKQSNLFKKAFSIDVDIEFLGVWDTVSSVGIIPRRLPFTTSNTVVKTFRHAVSLDERRAKFKANLWNRPNKKEQKLSQSETINGYVKEIVPETPVLLTSPASATTPGQPEPAKQVEEPLIKLDESNPTPSPIPVQYHPHHSETAPPGFNPSVGVPVGIPASSAANARIFNFGGSGKKNTLTTRALEKKWNKDRDAPTDIEEVWFAGCHCDIGGGSVTNGVNPCLARIPLRWMIRECFKTKSGIQFHSDGLRAIGLDPATLYPTVLPRPPALPAVDAASGQAMKIQNIPKKQRTIYDDLDDNSDEAPLLNGFNTNGMMETEEEAELKDSLAPIYDQLSLKWGWWVLEMIPMRHRVQVEGDVRWEKRWSMNLGGGRELPGHRHKKTCESQGEESRLLNNHHKVRVHRSVKTRIESTHEDGTKYWPKAKVVKCTFDKWTKRITFSSARNCSYDLLRLKVEQGFSLYATSFSINYKDDDGLITDISTDEDLSEAVQYFQTGVDDALSILSGRSFGGRKITLRVDITVDYDGPPLSDTSSLVSLDEFKNRDGSQHSFSFGSPSIGTFDDDSRTVSSSDQTNGNSEKGKGSSSTPLVKQRSIISLSDKADSVSLSKNGDILDSHYQRGNTSVFDNGPTATGSRFPEYTSGPFEQLKQAELLEDAVSSPGSNYIEAQKRGAAWLRAQNERARLGVLPGSSESDGMSISQDSLDDPFEGDLSLQMDQRGKYYYNYTSGSSVTREDDLNNGVPGAALSSRNSFQGPRPTSMQLKWLKSQRVEPEQDESRRSYIRSSASIQEEDLQAFETFDKELLLFLPVTAPPQELLTDCSNCGILLDAFRYVCSTCGEKAPKGQPDKGKEKDSSPGDPFTYPPQPQHLFSSPNSSSSETYIGGSESGSRRHKPLPSIPSPLLSPLPSIHSLFNKHKPPSSVSTGSSQTAGNGYELCSACLETVGIHHAIEAGLAFPGSSSVNGFSGAPDDPQSASQWRRAAPKKGQLRHAYQEKIWGHTGWEDVELEEAQVSQCSTCSAVTLHKRYKCASCPKMHLCRACYSQVHELHPSHAFIAVPDQRMEVTASAEHPQAHPNEEHSLKHQGVKCAHCLLDIVGARFHCAICDTVDICSNCESAGLPGNLDSDDGGHNSSHILIKIPYPLETTELQNASRRALSLWQGRDAANVGFTFPKTKANSEISSYAHTLIGSSMRNHNQIHEDHHVFCNGCQQGFDTNVHIVSQTMAYAIQVPRRVDRPIESHFPLLPPLYKVPVGPLAGAPQSNDPKGYLRHLIHSSAVCDRCMTCIQGEWFRCCYCARDLCEDCQEVDTHNDKHIFLVFKSSVDMQLFKNFANLESPTPVIPYPIYR
ncbi:hypothetical protein CVT24_006272 [Panaeolus cyanescens]|uniref:ZZ-type domain-containing protein n=1 Tax=Panaeolus cyanescens TaxID=181874 RepID=A0A409V8I6_9AGAR|nr:hypothetical protein CVT24_006272 [Panaeolus cyanescens]